VRRAIAVLTCVVAVSTVWGQGVCPAGLASSKLICVIPQLYGPKGLTLPNPFHSAHFDSDFNASFTPLNSAVGTQLSLLPLASPASGFTFMFDRNLGVFTRSAESFGPLLVDRAETIGKHRVFVGFTFQHFGFSSLDGVNLDQLPAVFTHIDCCNANGSTRGPGDPPSPGSPSFEQEFIQTTNRIDLKVNQFTLFGTFGVTNRIDVSVALPILDVALKTTSNATIVRKVPPGAFGFAHYFDPNCIGNIPCQAASTQKSFFNSGSAAGIGDMVLRIKDNVWKGERFGLGLGVDTHWPTGDETNFLGAGAYGVKPFVVLSYRARISPHVNVGYEWNGDSILAGDILTGSQAKLPNQFFYSGGADYGVNRHLTVVADLLGKRIFNAVRARPGPYVDILGQTHNDIPQTILVHESFEVSDLAVGMKFSPWRNLLVEANALVKLDDGGLRSRVVPLGGISYTF